MPGGILGAFRVLVEVELPVKFTTEGDTTEFALSDDGPNEEALVEDGTELVGSGE